MINYISVKEARRIVHEMMDQVEPQDRIKLATIIDKFDSWPFVTPGLDYEYRKLVKRSSLNFGILVGLNTAVQYLQEVLIRPDTVEVFLKMAQEIREAVENDYEAAKQLEKEYAVEHGYIESEDEDGESE